MTTNLNFRCQLKEASNYATVSTSIFPSGIIEIEFFDNGIFVIAGDLIGKFETLLSESLKVILKIKKAGQIYSEEVSGVLSISLSQEGALVIKVFEDFLRLDQMKPSYSVSIDPMEWLCAILNEFHALQDCQKISRETYLRGQKGTLISLLDVFL